MKQDDWYSKLTEAEKAIWKIIYYNPTFIINRTVALNWIFCVIGTGIEWNEKGELKDTIDNNYMNRVKREIHSFDKDLMSKAYTNIFFKKSDYTERLYRCNIEWMRSYAFYENCIAESTLKNIKKLVTTAYIPKSFYPLCQYSNLMTVPKNVKTDWLDLAIETCDLILATDPTIRDYEGRLLNKNNIKLAKKQKIKLLKIRKENKERKNPIV